MGETRETIIADVPALTLPPADIARLLKKIALCFGVEELFFNCSVHTSIHFMKQLAKVPNSFVDIVRNDFESQIDAITARHLFTQNNRALLFLIWLRFYPTYYMLSSLFNIRVTTVKEEMFGNSAIILKPNQCSLKNINTYTLSFLCWPSRECLF